MLQEETSPPSERLIIEAEQANYDQLAIFFTQNNRTHRHLDWLSTLEWLGSHPYLIELKDQQVQAVLCAAPENEKAAWVRVFGVKKNLAAEESWQCLLPRAVQTLRDMKIDNLASLALHPWFEVLLKDSGFINRQNIVVLEWQGEYPEMRSPKADILIRQMHAEDLPTVKQIDDLAFAPLWQNTSVGLSKAFNQTGIATVAQLDGEIVGYQISTTMTIYGHLSRLAVHPAYQRKNIAYSLVYDLLKRFEKHGIWQITVNTQSNNIPSLKLYEGFIFKPIKEEIRVYELELA